MPQTFTCLYSRSFINEEIILTAVRKWYTQTEQVSAAEISEQKSNSVVGRQLRHIFILQCPPKFMDIAETFVVQDSVARGSAGLYETVTHELGLTERQEEQ